MIDRDEIVADTIRRETRDSKVHRAGFKVRPLGRQVVKRAFLESGDTRIEVGVLSQPKGRRGGIDYENSAMYLTDHAAVPPVTHWLVDMALGRHAQTTQSVDKGGFLVAAETITPLTPLGQEPADSIVMEMTRLLARVETPLRNLEYPRNWLPEPALSSPNVPASLAS